MERILLLLAGHTDTAQLSVEILLCPPFMACGTDYCMEI